MTTRREYAASLGLAQLGARGRLSREANDAIAKAEAEGQTFEDGGPKITKEPKPRPTKVATNVVQTIADRFFEPSGATFRVELPGGKIKTLHNRTACHCGASLMYCPCSVPQVPLLVVDPSADATSAFLPVTRS